MGLIASLRELVSEAPFHERTSPFVEVPTLEQQMARIMRVQSAARPWRTPSITEALGVPAIQRAVTLIANTTGSLSIEGWANGVKMDETPRVITRPDPYQTPRDFYRDCGWNLATRGESVLWIASRDQRGTATALVVVPLAELTIEENLSNRLRSVYRWGDVKSTRYSPANPEGAFVHVTYLREPGALRGVGPLQLAGAAASVSVESQEWAANFYSVGGHASTIIKSAVQLDEAEAAALKGQWTDVPSNVPRVIDTNIESVTETDVNPQGAQMLEAREYQNGDAARLFGIPGSLMEYGSPGSSLTYQNLSDVWVQFVRGCLAPNYLAPLEQALSDLLPRSQTVRFSVAGLERADVKTRYDVYASGITSGVLTAESAQMMEGIIPGSVEMAPVPASPPAAVPARLPAQLRTAPDGIRCSGLRMRSGRMVPCGKLLSTSGHFEGMCPRCKSLHVAA